MARSGKFDGRLGAVLPPVFGSAAFDVRDIHCLIVPADTEEGSANGNGSRRELAQIQLDGRCYRIVQQLPTNAGPGADDPTELLTARELEIVRLVCLGHVNKRIADRLRISEYTVKTYLKQIFIKLGVRSRAAMVFRCARHLEMQPPPQPQS